MDILAAINWKMQQEQKNLANEQRVLDDMLALARIPARARDQSAQTRSFRQGDSANSAPRERHHDEEHLPENGECGRSECDEIPGNDVCNCATGEARKHANYVEVFPGWKSASLDAGCKGNLAERGDYSL
jgi:hypothetical protein